jgi:replicative DNA helicase
MNKPVTPPVSPPHSIEAEQGLLGAILINNEALSVVRDIVETHHFFEPINRDIYEICLKMISEGKLASPVTIRALFSDDNDIAGLSLSKYLARLAAEAATVINAPDYATIIRDHHKRRALIRVGEDIINRAFDIPVDDTPELQIEAAEQALYEIDGTNNRLNPTRSQEQILRGAVDLAAQAYKRPGTLPGLSTGLTDLDDPIGGLQQSDLIVLAGRPGMGKTALATDVACNVARSEAPVLFFSLEMSAEQLGLRMLATRVGTPSNEIQRGKFRSEDFDRIQKIATDLRGPLYVDDTGALSIAQLAMRARQQHRRRGIRLIIVDYLQLLRGTTRRSAEVRVQEITEITSGLKAIAKELNVPVLALSQLSRAVESRVDKRPHLSDLRDSGTIEQDADVVLFVFREAYYHAMRKPDDESAMGTWAARAEQLHNRAEVIVAKNRHGSTANVELFFDPEITHFSSLERRYGKGQK